MDVYLDTNIFLNVIYKESKFAAKSAELLRRIQGDEVKAVTSAVTLLEVVLDMAASGFSDQSEAAVTAIEDISGLTIVPLDNGMSRTAARHVLEDKVTVHDAYHLATALHSGVSYLVTRDTGLSRKIGRYIRVVTPEEVLSLQPSGQI